MARRGRGRDFIQPPEEEEKKNELSYMQPEIMPVHIMEVILKERGMSASILQNADRKMVVKFFYKHVSPKYQRDYRENRRGKILKKVRQRRERKVDNDDWKKLLIDPKDIKTSSHYSSSKGSSSRDRLKPPPAKSLDEIVIKEHKVRSKESDKDGDKDKKRRDSDHEDKPVKKIKHHSSSEKRHSEDDSSQSGKKIKLKRDVSWP